MRLDRLTSKFQLALQDAQSMAVVRDHAYIEPAHLLVAMLNQEGGTLRSLLTASGVDGNTLRVELDKSLDRLPKVSGSDIDVQISPVLGRLLNQCDKLAQERKDAYISSELFLLAALDDKGELGENLKRAGLTKERLNEAIDNVRGGQKVDDPNAEEN